MELQQQLFPATLMPDRDWWQALWAAPRATMEAIGIKPGMRVIDLCCGDGYFTSVIAEQVGNGNAVGFDLDPAMLEQAMQACSSAGNCHWVTGDARDLSRLIEEKADYVLIANTFHGVPDQLALAHEVTAILKPGGQFAIVNWHPLPREHTTVLGQPRGPRTEMRMSPDAVKAAVEPAGFKLDSVVELPLYHYAAIFSVKPSMQDKPV